MSVPVYRAGRFGRITDDLFASYGNVGIDTPPCSPSASTYRRGRSLSPQGTSPPSTLPPNYIAGIGYCISRRLEANVDIAGVVDRVLPDLGKRAGGQGPRPR